MTQVRLRAYTPNGATLGPLPAPTDLSASMVLNDLGALSLSYEVGAARADLLGQPMEVALETSSDNGVTWAEPPSARFLYLRDGRDPVKRDAYKVECPGYGSRLAKALVPFTGLNTDGRREFTAQTPGQILHPLLSEAQTRGALTGITWNFTTATDSGGVAWVNPQNISYEPGKDLLTVLRELADLGFVDWRMNARVLEVYNPGSVAMAADKTTGASPVSLRFGRDLSEAPFRRTWEALADTALVGGDEGTWVERTAAGALKPWGRQENYVSASGVTDPGTLNVIGDASLVTTSTERIEYTFGLEFGRAAYLPFRDYSVGQFIWALTSGAVQPGAAPANPAAPASSANNAMRVRQITLTKGNDGTAGNVVLNDRFAESDVRQQRLIQAIINGGTVATGGGAVTPPGPDILAPSQVTGLLVSSVAYLDPQGIPRAQVGLDWADTITNADGTPLTDLGQYELQGRKNVADTPWRTLAFPSASAANLSPFEVSTQWQFRVRAIDSVGNEGAWSSTVTHTTAFDAVGPIAPKKPTLSSRMGVLQVGWDGLNGINGGGMDADLVLVRVHVSTVSGFTPDATTFRGTIPYRGGAIPVVGLPYATPLYAKLVGVDSSGNLGAESAQETHTMAALVDVSNFPDDAMEVLYARTAHFIDVTADMIVANAVQAEHIDFGSLSGEVVTGLTIRTADSGERVVVRNDGSGGIIEFFGDSTDPSATPAKVDPGSYGSGAHGLSLVSGTNSLLPYPPVIRLIPGATQVGTTGFGGSVTIWGFIQLNGAIVNEGHRVRGTDAGRVVTNTDGAGKATVAFDIPFVAGTNVIVLATGGNGEQVAVDLSTVNLNGFSAYCRTPTGVLITSNPVTICWVAQGRN